jgi:hypothetical protein
MMTWRGGCYIRLSINPSASAARPNCMLMLCPALVDNVCCQLPYVRARRMPT